MLNTSPLTTKITDSPVRESASEWVSSTIDAPAPISSPQDQLIASNPATPGPHVPGAFPDPYFRPGVVQQDVQYVKDAAINAIQTAKGYVSTGVEDMKRLIENTSDTVGGYLPQSVTAYLPHHTTADNSLPSEPKLQDMHSASSMNEGGTYSAHQSTYASLPSEETSQNMGLGLSGGAGALPGPPGEFGVAVLPDECVSSRPNLEDLHSETGIAILPEERRQQNLPSHDDHSPFVTEKRSTGGVGTLPGDKEEAGVALLPEERKSLGASTDNASTRLLHGTPPIKVHDPEISQDTLPVAGSPSFAPLPSNSDKTTTASSMADASHPVIPNTTARTYPLASNGVKFKGVPLSKGLQKELAQEQLSPTESIDGPRTQSDLSTVAAAGTETVRKKPGFMDRLKGEVKVISGKLAHKESKVEEGRKLMGRN